MCTTKLIPEWDIQDAVVLSWPHTGTDWAPILEETEACYRAIAIEILKREKLILVGNTAVEARASLPLDLQSNCIAYPLKTNDTWIRDYGPLCCVDQQGKKVILDCGFNAWGLKFSSYMDNQVVRQLYQMGAFAPAVDYHNELGFIFEGGAIETNGAGLLMSTDSCLYEGNRNPQMQQLEIVNRVQSLMGGKQLFSLKNGSIPGDDTDGHIDTLARFIAPNLIAYVSPSDSNSYAYPSLLCMEQELRVFAQENALELLPLPDVGNYFDEDGELIPATYANFLFINQALLLPVYGRRTDSEAVALLQKALPDRTVCAIDCSVLIRQHGSLHCVSMQIPKGFLK